MTEASPPNPLPGAVPPPPPALKVKVIWISLLAPLVLAVLFMTIMVVFARQDEVVQLASQVGCGVVCLAVACGWGFFANALARRFRGASLVLLILAYPVLQAILLFAIVFVGCLAAFSRIGIGGP